MKPMTYGAVAPGLFDAIVADRAPPNPAAARRITSRVAGGRSEACSAS